MWRLLLVQERIIFFSQNVYTRVFPFALKEFPAAAYQSYRRRRWCLKRSKREEISMIMLRWCVLMLWIGYPSFQNTLYISSSSSCPQKMLHVPVPCPRHGDEHGTQSIGLISHSLITAIDLFKKSVERNFRSLLSLLMKLCYHSVSTRQ